VTDFNTGKFSSFADPKRSPLAHWSALRACAFLLVVCIAAAAALSAQDVTTLLTFDGTNGSSPIPGIVEDKDGNFYGTTASGGTSGGGTVFKIAPEGTVSTLYNFCTDSGCGRSPDAALVLGTDGNFYGTTFLGGTTPLCNGTVFKLTPAGTLTTLYSFCKQSSGELPEARLVQAADGNFYGTTYQGGTLLSGTVFRITPRGKLTTIHTFCSESDCEDGANPAGPGMILGADGNLYGTTTQGGSNDEGTIFQITLAGDLTTLYSFSNSENIHGAGPILQATNGNFYGTLYGGCNGNLGCGTVFELTPAGVFTTLYTFCQLAFCADGENPVSLVQGSDGSLYGTTQYGGISANGDFGIGTIFRITPSGKFTSLYAFCTQSGCPDGAYPGNLVESTCGNFFGATESSPGTLFKADERLRPFVHSLPRFGKVGATVTIFGNKLDGSTSVSFNGTAAAFTVISDRQIEATVPAGATTGQIQLTTAHGTVASDVAFSVLP
jgi:uncharacterized repeat protein (TIGR03803 family)